MLLCENLKEIWRKIGFVYVAGVYMHPLWQDDFAHVFIHESDTVCIARAVGYCLASHRKPVLVIIKGEYVSFQELSDAIRSALHLPIVFLFLTPLIYKLKNVLPDGLHIDTHVLSLRHSEASFFHVPQESLDQPVIQDISLEYIQHYDLPRYFLTEINHKITQSYRPVILLGKSITKMPVFPPIPIVVGDVDALQLVATDHKYSIGKFGRTGDRAANMAVQNADLVLVIGDVEWKPWYARHAHILWVSFSTLVYSKNVDRYECDPNLFLRKWQLSHNAKWNDWVHICRTWKSRWMLEIPPPSLTLSKLCLYTFHALIQQHYIGLCRYIVAKQDDFFWCPLHQQMIMDDYPRRLFARPFHDILMFACGVHEHVDKEMVLFLPQTNTLQYEHLTYIEQQRIPLLMFLIDTGKNRFALNDNGYYDMVRDGIELKDITNIPSVSIHQDNIYDMLATLDGSSIPKFVWVECDDSFTPYPIGMVDRPPEEMEPDDGMTHEMIVPPLDQDIGIQ